MSRLMSGQFLSVFLFLFRWKLHSDWITDLKYFGNLRVFASSACDSTVSLLMGKSWSIYTCMYPYCICIMDDYR